MNLSEQNRWVGYALLAAGVLLLAIAGYMGYTLYPRFNLPSVSGAALYILAAAAGVAAFFSPCSFPLLATLLARSIGDDKPTRKPLTHAVRYGAALALGSSTFMLITGGAIARGGGVLFSQVTFASVPGRVLRLAVGGILVFLGLVQIGLVSVRFDRVARLSYPLEKAQARLRRERPAMGFALFGFGYILAGFG